MTDEMQTVLDPRVIDREVKLGYARSFDTSVQNRRTFGSIPPELHSAVLEQAQAHDMMVGQYIASLMIFRLKYEAAYKEYLDEQRAGEDQFKLEL